MQRRVPRWLSAGLATLGLATAPLRSQDPLVQVGDVALGFSADGGFLLAGAGAANPHEFLRSGGPAWAVTFTDGSAVTAAEFLAAPWSGNVRTENLQGRLLQHWESPELALDLEAAPSGDGIALRLHVRRAQRPLERIDFPSSLRFDPAAVAQVVFPQRAGEGVGLALAGRFFGPHVDPPGGYANRTVGPQAYAALLGAPLKQLADNEPPVTLRVTDTGREWFSAATAARVNAASLCVNRPPAPGQMPIVLVDSDSGPAVAAADLGGQGLMLRFAAKTGGQAAEREGRLQQAIVIDATEALARRHPERFRSRTVAVIALDGGPEAGGWTATPVSQWAALLRASAVLRQAGATVAVLRRPVAVRQAWSDGATALILNPYGESLPTGSAERWRDDIEAIRGYVRGGGFWWEVGGYPFHYVLEPQPYLHVDASYPGCTADFVHLQGARSALAILGVQPLLRQPWDRERAVTPGALAVTGTPAGAEFRHSWSVDLPAGQPWSSPPLRLLPGLTPPAALAAYAEAIGLRTPLTAKLKAPVLDRLKSAVLVRLGGATAAEQTKALERLPAGSLVHFTEYMKGGFDKQYPDHLPPRESWGTAAELKAFYDRGHELGHLMMPYTNTSWWCIDPKGPTFEKEGEAPLSRRRDGSLFKERYSVNEGYRVCFWHPAVQEAHRRTRRQMSEEFPSDVLFQDQVGARGWSWDFNPAAPSATAWIDGLHSLGLEDAATVPLATEDGHDRVVEFESMFCGMAWSIVPSGGQREAQRLAYRYPPGEWAIFPIIQYLAHDKVLFTLHDLGHFVLNDEQLAYVLGLGYALSYRLSGAELERAEVRDWLGWLDAVQKAVCSRYAGQPLTEFAQTGGQPGALGGPLLTASYPGIRIWANTGTASLGAESLGPMAAWASQAGLVLAGPGFLASGNGLQAGLLQTTAPDAARFGFVLQADTTAGGTRGVLHAAAGQEVLLPWPGKGVPAPLQVAGPDGRAVAVSVSRRGDALALRLPEIADPSAPARMPSRLQGRPVADWGTWGRTVAVLTMGEGAPSSWTLLEAEEWRRLLEGDAALRAAGATVRPVADAAELRRLLRAEPGERPFAVVNPGGEVFYAEDAASADTMLDDIRAYVRDGGIWWETGGYSFYTCAYRDAQGDWARRPLGPAGARRLGFACAGFEVDTPAEPLRVTPAGRPWFDNALVSRIEASTSGIQRGFEDDGPTLVLVESQSGDFAAAIRGQGWGWLFRLGGFRPDPGAAGAIVSGSLRHLLTRPWPEPVRRTPPRLWTVRAPAQ